MTKSDEEKLDTFLHKALRRILKIHWPMRITNQTISEIVKKNRQWKWIGENRFNMSTSRQKKRGKTDKNWRRTVEKKGNQWGYKIEAEVAPQDRDAGPILHQETRKR
uniref:Uncharacterized protein LOC102803129 n=1 Tax=Saccoglossus kowalevskii TaxID=10224 RepID=A0ABM0MSN9_SACKO|nr:PREDICTED: uncharacterized protein LOC102803129 [Saccoglossus kowalevskii]